MTEQEKQIVAKASVPMTVANGFRWVFLLVALFLLLFLFFGGKIWGDAAWYAVFTAKAYSFLMWDILLMLISTIVKIAFTVRYNNIVRKL